jgi:DNA replication initiation complex subunit (GINS family)
MKTITLEVSEPTAEKISKMTPTEKELIAKSLDRLVSNRRSLSDIMHEASEQARKNGLTPEILEELLKEQ